MHIIQSEMELITPEEIINDCRDPKDNKFLEVAAARPASCIITGDDDLLILNPFRNTLILEPKWFYKYV